MRIGELARRSGVAATTLRFYEDAGVLAPPKRTASGYRDYDDTVLDRLAFIHHAQAAGLTLTEIRGIIRVRDDGIAPCSHAVALIERKAAEVTRQIAELRALEHELDRLRTRATAIDPATCDPRHVCEVFAPSAP